MIKKLIVTNSAVLKKKYGASGWKAVQLAIARLAMADSLRGITTTLGLVDAPGTNKVTTPSSGKQNKQAIDALFVKAQSPDYLLLLGGPDVIPHQSLQNPLASDDPDGDPDQDIPSDLPYACEATYSRRVEDFLGPTRAVGRLPDLPRSKQVELLVGLIDRAAAFVGTPMGKPFVVAAHVWKSATNANIKLAFGKASAMGISPVDGPLWPSAKLRSPLHFINCHGGAIDPNYYGDPDFPVAHEPGNLKGAVASGAVVVAECCYGAELYAPTAATPVGIAFTYLIEGAAAFCGSTNTAYGEEKAADRCAADILCTEFMKTIVGKATTGRALLQSRQQYVLDIGEAELQPIDLKTLGQFLLLGDPSLRPYGSSAAPKALGLSKSVLAAATSATGATPASAKKFASTHRSRRTQLQKSGKQLADKAPVMKRTQTSMPEANAVVDWAIKKGVEISDILTFTVSSPKPTPPRAKGKAKRASAKALAQPSSTKVHVVFDRAPRERVALSRRSDPLTIADAEGRPLLELLPPRMHQLEVQAKSAPIKQIRAWIIRSSGGKVLSYQRASSKSGRK